MRIVTGPSHVTLWTPAKINFFLEVWERRADGFHELETLIVPVSLFDTLHCQANQTGRVEFRMTRATGALATAAECSGSNLWDEAGDSIPEDDRNLVVRAVKMLQNDFQVREGMSIHLHKRIPSQAGLGGGSSDAAAALVAANLLWGLQISATELRQAAARIGSDVPFFLAGGAAVCRGRGEQVRPVVVGRRLPVVIVKPPAGLETAHVFRNCEIPTNPNSLPCLDLQPLFRVLFFNRLQFAAEVLYPRITQIKNLFSELRVAAHQMTGSGSAYFGVLHDVRSALRVARRVRQANLGQVFLTHCMI